METGNDTYHIIRDDADEQSIYHLVNCSRATDWEQRIAGPSSTGANGKSLCLTGIRIEHARSELNYVHRDFLVRKAVNLYNSGRKVCKST